MDAVTFFATISSLVFGGDEYEAQVVRITVHLHALDLWEAVEEDYEDFSLPANPIMDQLMNHKVRKIKKTKAKCCLFSAVSKVISKRIMNLKYAKDIWDYLKLEYHGIEGTKGIQVLNLTREFEMQIMKEREAIKGYTDRLLSIVNKVRVLCKDFPDERLEQKILVIVPKIYEPESSSLEESEDLSSISFGELVNALHA